MVVMSLSFMALPANAQLGNLLKKAKKAVKTITNVASGNSVVGANAVEIPSGGTMENPLSAVADFELVGAYGKSTSLNYGEVYLVLKVKMIANKPKIYFSGMVDQAKMIAVDNEGNTYTIPVGWQPKDVTEGMFVKMKLDGGFSFKDVKKTATTMQLIRLTVSLGNVNNQGCVIFRNVPIQWDVEPE